MITLDECALSNHVRAAVGQLVEGADKLRSLADLLEELGGTQGDAEVFGQEVPKSIPSSRRMDDWPPFAAGLLARSYYLLESVAAVSNREIDAAILTRALYEHVVTFAWIAIDPRKNLPAFFSWEYEERKKAVNDVESIGGIDDDGDWRRALEQFRRMYVPEPVAPAPPMPARAHAAAERWDAITNHGLRPKYSFRGMYPLVYRNFSGHAHPTSRLLLPFIHGSNGVLHVSRPVLKSPLHALGMAPVLFGLALLVASEALQYPKRANVMAAFEAAAGDDDDPDDVSP